MERLPEPLWGRWYLGEQLYAGESTEVYALTLRGSPGRACVLKRIRVPCGRADELARVWDSVRVQERMSDCGGAVAIYDEEQLESPGADGTPAFWEVLLRMERLDCLAELLREGTQFSEEEILRLARDLLETLVFARQLNLVHRDIKPANIYRAPSGRWKLGDFGVCARADGPALASAAGTAAYMAPEAAAGRSSGAQEDLYSLGVVLYQLLNGGFLPMTGADSTYAETQNSIAARLRGARVPPVRCRSRQLRRAVLRACNPNPARRYSGAAQMLADLTPRSRPALLPACACLLALAAGFAAARLSARPRQLSPDAVSTAAPAAAAHSAESASQSSSAVPAAVTERTEDGSGETDVVHRYEVILQPLSWLDAKLWCETRGGHLATITSAEESAQVTELLTSAGAQAVWLGADNRNTANGFTWVTGEAFRYAEWGPGEPNNDGGTEYYLMLAHSQDEGWVWNDSRNDGLAMFPTGTGGFVCEWEGDAP
jgi:hypothetical protein